MKRLVMKFGGASLSESSSFEHVSELIVERLKTNDRVVVVVSAMKGVTDHLHDLAYSIHDDPPKREMDMLLTVGERVSMSLLAMALAKKGVESISLTGSQSGIITCGEHSDARILEVRPIRIEEALKNGLVVIVAGFQGVSEKKEITTLGRGGSDTTAVALAIALKAENVEFYKDVQGIFLEDPKGNPQAEHLPVLSYRRALELVELSEVKVLHPRAIKLAMKEKISLHVRSFKERGQKVSIVTESE